MTLSITTAHVEDGLVVSVHGEVDVSCADKLRDALDAALATQDTAAVAVDLAEVPYIDSTGIGVLVGAAHRAAESDVAFRVVNPQRNVARVLAMLGLEAELGLSAVAKDAE